MSFKEKVYGCTTNNGQRPITTAPHPHPQVPNPGRMTQGGQNQKAISAYIKSSVGASIHNI